MVLCLKKKLHKQKHCKVTFTSCRSLEVWGSPEALARERKRRKEAEIKYRESEYRVFKYLEMQQETMIVRNPQDSVTLLKKCKFGTSNC